jgi:hypothetical protein
LGTISVKALLTILTNLIKAECAARVLIHAKSRKVLQQIAAILFGRGTR